MMEIIYDLVNDMMPTYTNLTAKGHIQYYEYILRFHNATAKVTTHGASERRQYSVFAYSPNLSWVR